MLATPTLARQEPAAHAVLAAVLTGARGSAVQRTSGRVTRALTPGGGGGPCGAPARLRER